MSPIDELSGFQSEDAEQRRVAVQALAQGTPERALPLLIPRLADEDWRVRKEAASVVQSIEPRAEVVDALLAALRTNDDVGFRNAAVEALAGFGVLAVQQLKAALRDYDADLRKLAAEILGRSRQAQAFGVLTALIRDPDENVRVAAIDAIESIGIGCVDEIRPVVVELIRTGSRLEKLAALEAGNHLGLVLDWELLEPLFGDHVLREAVALALARLSESRAADVFAAWLEESGDSCEGPLLIALGTYLAAGREQFEAGRRALARLPEAVGLGLMERFAEAGAEEARAVVMLLAALGSEACQRAIFALSERDELAAWLDLVVEFLEGRAVPVLFALAEGHEPVARRAVLRQLGRLAELAGRERLLALLEREIESEDLEVVRWVFEIMHRISDARLFRRLLGRYPRLTGSLRRAAQGTVVALSPLYPEVARSVVEAAGDAEASTELKILLLGALTEQLGEMGVKLKSLCREGLRHESAEVRQITIETLTRLNQSRALDAVIFALTDESREVRLAAVSALGKLREPTRSAEIVSRISELLEVTEDQELMVAAIDALLSSQVSPLLPILSPLALGPHLARAVAAVEAIGRLTEPGRLDALLACLSHPEAEVVKAALLALLEGPELPSPEPLLPCLVHQEWDVRRLAADLLGSVKNDATVLVLRRRLAEESETMVRDAITRALGELEAPMVSRRSSPPPGMGSLLPR